MLRVDGGVVEVEIKAGDGKFPTAVQIRQTLDRQLTQAGSELWHGLLGEWLDEELHPRGTGDGEDDSTTAAAPPPPAPTEAGPAFEYAVGYTRPKWVIRGL